MLNNNLENTEEEILENIEFEEEDMGDTEETEEPSDIKNTPEGKNAKSAKEILSSLIKKNDIKYNNKNYSLEWLVDRIGSGKFRMPKYQRKYVWEDIQVTALIVSILKQIPIPKLYGYYTESQDSDQTTLVIDGQQRLTSLFMYYWGIFPKSKNNRIKYADKLPDIAKLCKEYYANETLITRKKEIKLVLKSEYQIITDYKFVYKSNEYDDQQHSLDLSYRGESELTPQQKFRLLDSELEFLIVQGHNYSDAVELFRVYNSAGTPLSTQEIRNGIYQNNHLYKRINQYSEDSLSIELNEESEFEFNDNWFHFSGTRKGSIGDKKEIKKLLQLLSYYFILSHEKTKVNEEESFVNKTQYLLDCLRSKSLLNFEEFEKNEIEFKKYKKFYGRKGSLEQMINDYSTHCADNGDNKEFLENEFQTVKQFFNNKFEEKINGDKINFMNLVMIYIILRVNNRLSSSICIPREALYYDCKGYGLNSEGFYYRLKEIWKILKNKDVI